jgi:glycine betaine/proline transport system substrate-binding protein
MISKKILIGGLSSLLLASSLFGAKVTALKSNIAEETFQMLVVNGILEKMGHEIASTNDVNYDIAFQTIANNANSEDVYFLASMWDPLHNTKLEALGGDKNIVTYDNLFLIVHKVI